MLQEQLDNLLVAKGTRPRQGAVRGGLGGGVDVCVPLQQEVSDGHVALTTGFEEGCVARLVYDN